MLNNILIFLILFHYNSVLTDSDDSIKTPVPVETDTGPIIGFKDSFESKEVDVFLGIPYAEPPVGNFRFEKPAPVGDWSEPFQANKWPNNCYQVLDSVLKYNSPVISEDCLYLNVWSPDANAQVKKPVIVFIHGGGLSSGSSTQYDGKVLSVLGNVVVVTLNYRLEAFGFLFAGIDDAPGNVGLWDQNLALKWVRDNIKHFGGSPQSVTLMGQNAGAWSASLHLLSPHSQELFHNAILLSGAAYHHLTERTTRSLKKAWLGAAIRIGCGEGEEYSYVGFTPHIINCLKEATPEQILEMTKDVGLSTPELAWDRLIVIDGQFLTDNPFELIQRMDLEDSLKNVLIGTIEDEGSIHLTKMGFTEKFSWNSDWNFTLEDGFNTLAAITTKLPSNLNIIGEEVSGLYFHGHNENTDAMEIRSIIGTAIGDYYFTCPSMKFAETLFSENIDNFRIFQYFFSNSVDLLGFNGTDKSYHMSDLLTIFGLPLERPDTSEEQKQITKELIDFIAHFVIFGQPKGQNGLDIQSYYEISSRIVKPYYEFSSQPKPNNNFGIGLKVIECDYLWNEYLDYQLAY